MLALGLGAFLAWRQVRAASLVALAGAAFAIGSLAALPLVRPAGADDVSRLAVAGPRSVTLVGKIAAEPWALPGRAVFDLRIEQASVSSRMEDATGLVRVSVLGLPEEGVPVLAWRRGDRLEVTGWLRAPRDFALPGVPSRVSDLGRQGIRSLLVAKAPQLVRTRSAARPGPVARLRAHVVLAIDRHVAGGRRKASDGSGLEVAAESAEAAVLRAMLVGDRALLDEESTRRLAEAGIIHVLSISGLHVGFVAALGYGLVGLVARREPPRLLAGVAAVWLYTVLAGSPVTAVRAALVASVVLVGRALYRDAPALNALALAFLLGGVLEPGGIRGPGFQMTFAAAAGLLLLTPPLVAVLGRVLPRFLALALAASLGAELFVLPVAVAHFGRVSLVGPLLNLAAVPLSALALYGGFALAGAAAVHDATAAVIGDLARLLVAGLLAVAEPHGLPWALRVACAPAPLALTAAGCLLLAVWPRLGRRGPRVGLVALALAMLLVPRRAPRSPGITVHVLDVGQGDATLVELADGTTMLVDAGGLARSRFDLGDRVIVPFLLARGHRRIDLAVVTHAHPDHAAGMLAVLRELQVGELWLGDDPAGDPLVAVLRSAAARRGTAVIEVRGGFGRDLGQGGRLRVLNPPGGREPPVEVENSRSVVLSLEIGRARVLLTGDIHADAEARLAGEADLGCDLLKVAHHGSRTSSDARFLAAAHPRLAVVSCGLDNSFGHPDAVVIERLAAAGSRLLRTDLDGMVTVAIDPAGRIHVATSRVRLALAGPRNWTP